MSSRNPFIDDFAKVASSAMSTIGGLRDEAQSAMKARFEAMIADMDMVTREEFEAVRAMALKAREENEALMQEILALKAKIDAPKVKTAAATRKTAAKTTAARNTMAKKPAAKRPAAKKAAPKSTKSTT